VQTGQDEAVRRILESLPEILCAGRDELLEELNG
jgi:hypothetical protein